MSLGFTVSAEGNLPSLQNTLQSASCSSSADATTTEGKTCRAVTSAYCSEMSDGQCSSHGTTPGSGRPVNLTASTFEQVKAQANSFSLAYAQAAKRAARCCGGASSCKPLFQAGSPEALTAQNAIDAASIQANTADPKASDADGLKNKCSVYKAQTENAGTVSASVAGMCKAYKSICVDGFRALSTGVKQKGSGADFEQLAQGFEAKATQCERLSAQAATDSAQSMTQNSLQGQGCETATNDAASASGTVSTGSGASAAEKAKEKEKGGGGDMKDIMSMAQQLMQQNQKKDDSSDDATATDPAATPADCSNPATAGCQAATAATSWNTQLGSGGAAGSSTTGGKFDVADTGGVQPGGFTPTAGAAGSPISVSSVPGGGGGGVGGMGGGGGANGGGGGGGGGGYAPKTNTDILHGEGGGGGGLAAMNAGMSTATGGASGGFTYGKGTKPEAEQVDWRQFLPGGAKDPTRKPAGATPARVEIQPSTTNIFQRVSERLRARCAAGLLRDCN